MGRLEDEFGAETTVTDPFVTIGGATPRDEATQARYDKLRNGLRTPPTGSGAADTVNALTEVYRILSNRTQTGVTAKPSLLLITDDIPIEKDLKYSPWGDNPSRWTEYITRYDTISRQLAGLTALKSVSPYCAQNNGGLTLSTIAIGTALWVNDSGVIEEPYDGRFYTAKAQAGWISRPGWDAAGLSY